MTLSFRYRLLDALKPEQQIVTPFIRDSFAETTIINMAPTTEVTFTIPTLEGIAAVLAVAYYATGEVSQSPFILLALTKV